MCGTSQLFAILLVIVSILIGGCSTIDTAPGNAPTVQKELTLSFVPQVAIPSTYKVSSLQFTGPKTGAVVFAYADVTPPTYVSSMMIPGGTKRADVIYRLENDVDAIISKAMAQVFSLDNLAPASVSGQITLKYSDVTPVERKGSTSGLNVAVEVVLNLEVRGNSSTIMRKSYISRKSDTSSGLLITFPTNGFMNALFAEALRDLLVTVSSDEDLATAVRR